MEETRAIRKKIAEKIKSSRTIAITSHLRPDGDSIGSGIALYLMLKALGKEVRYINRELPGLPLSKLPFFSVIEEGEIDPQLFDLVILIECSTEDRSGQKNLDKYFRILIDHHLSNDGKVELNWVNHHEAAVSVMVYELAEDLGVAVDKTMASLLYCALVSDTGGYRFTNINSKAFAVASRLIEAGADPIATNRMLFECSTFTKVRLTSLVLSTLKEELEGQVATICLLQEHLRTLDIQDVETEDILTIVRSIESVKLVIFMKEYQPERFRISLRSRDPVDSSKIAESFGGGGHKHASGLYLEGKREEVARKVLAALPLGGLRSSSQG